MHPKSRELLAALREIEAVPWSPANRSERTAATRRYLILFTPRSGSSWFAELLRRNGGFGKPDEWLNPNLMPATARRFGVDNVKDYLDRTLEEIRDPRTGAAGVFVTYFQLEVMREIVDVFRYFPSASTRFVCLTRRDRVAQSISLYKAVSSGFFHSSSGEVANRPAVPYDPQAIARWHEHIRAQERGLEILFRDCGIDPIRLTYEDMIALGPESTLNMAAVVILGRRHLGEVVLPVDHQRLPSEGRDEWVRRLRDDQPQLFPVETIPSGR